MEEPGIPGLPRHKDIIERTIINSIYINSHQRESLSVFADGLFLLSPKVRKSESPKDSCINLFFLPVFRTSGLSDYFYTNLALDQH